MKYSWKSNRRLCDGMQQVWGAIGVAIPEPFIVCGLVVANTKWTEAAIVERPMWWRLTDDTALNSLTRLDITMDILGDAKRMHKNASQGFSRSYK